VARPSTTSLAISRIETEEKTTDLRLRLKGRLAVDLADYLRAYAETNGGHAVELDQLVPHMLAAFIEADRGFQSWRRNANGKTATGAARERAAPQ
jgi:hypothetical protein